MRFVPLEIIPTCTGNTQSGRLTSKFKWDHPRTCGEHSTVTISPLLSVGSSPHVRGARSRRGRRPDRRGIIPACAGSTRWSFQYSLFSRDHPRMCGEHARAYSIRAKRLGSSPHVRGALPHESTSFYVCGIIPACAGSTADLIKKWAAIRDHPRMCGEHR